MGSKISLEGRFDNNNDSSKCFICSKKINVEDLVVCVRCNISLHNTFYDKNCDNKNYTKCSNKICSDKNYTICPNCNHIGSLGIYMK